MTEEQTLLYDTVLRLVTSAGRPDQSAWHTRGKALWPELSALGLAGLQIAEAHGGSAGSARDVAVVMEAWGRGLLRAPLVSTAVVGASLISAAGTAGHQERWLPAIARGECCLALADLEPGARYTRESVTTHAVARGEGYVISGRKANVIDGDLADLLLVTARVDGDDGLTLFLVDARATGVERTSFPTLDGGGCAQISFDGVFVKQSDILGTVGGAASVLDAALDRGLTALCSEAVGAMQALLGQTAEYLKQRHQFGQPLAHFQALQHHIADMALDTGAARSAALMAAAAIDGGVDVASRRRCVAAAKAFVGEAGRRVAEMAVQLHGGMGMTDELAIGHYFKRLHVIDLTWGDATHHLDVYSELMKVPQLVDVLANAQNPLESVVAA